MSQQAQDAKSVIRGTAHAASDVAAGGDGAVAGLSVRACTHTCACACMGLVSVYGHVARVHFVAPRRSPAPRALLCGCGFWRPAAAATYHPGGQGTRECLVKASHCVTMHCSPRVSPPVSRRGEGGGTHLLPHGCAGHHRRRNRCRDQVLAVGQRKDLHRYLWTGVWSR